MGLVAVTFSQSFLIPLMATASTTSGWQQSPELPPLLCRALLPSVCFLTALLLISSSALKSRQDGVNEVPLFSCCTLLWVFFVVFFASFSRVLSTISSPAHSVLAMGCCYFSEAECVSLCGVLGSAALCNESKKGLDFPQGILVLPTCLQVKLKL